MKINKAENLSGGWNWIHYDDGSGHLRSPEGEKYFLYDWNTGEYKISEEDEHYDFYLDENYSTNGYSIGSFEEFKEYAEKYINENVISQQKTITQEEHLIIKKICDRAETLGIMQSDKIDLALDIENVHKAIGLKLNDLLKTNNLDFVHDIEGIQNNIDRERKMIVNDFVPLCALKEEQNLDVPDVSDYF